MQKIKGKQIENIDFEQALITQDLIITTKVGEIKKFDDNDAKNYYTLHARKPVTEGGVTTYTGEQKNLKEVLNEIFSKETLGTATISNAGISIYYVTLNGSNEEVLTQIGNGSTIEWGNPIYNTLRIGSDYPYLTYSNGFAETENGTPKAKTTQIIFYHTNSTQDYELSEGVARKFTYDLSASATYSTEGNTITNPFRDGSNNLVNITAIHYKVQYKLPADTIYYPVSNLNVPSENGRYTGTGGNFGTSAPTMANNSLNVAKRIFYGYVPSSVSSSDIITIVQNWISNSSNGARVTMGAQSVNGNANTGYIHSVYTNATSSTKKVQLTCSTPQSSKIFFLYPGEDKSWGSCLTYIYTSPSSSKADISGLFTKVNLTDNEISLFNAHNNPIKTKYTLYYETEDNTTVGATDSQTVEIQFK